MCYIQRQSHMILPNCWQSSPPTTEWHNIAIILIFAADITSNPITYTLPRKWWKIPLSIHHENTTDCHELLNIRLTIQNLKYEYHFCKRFGPVDIKMSGSKHTLKTIFKFWNIKVEPYRGHTMNAMLLKNTIVSTSWTYNWSSWIIKY
jgi:hypothetical protein